MKLSVFTDIQNQMAAEKQAIEKQLQAYKQFETVLKKFDGKIINQRLYTALKAATGQNIFRDGFYYNHLNTEMAVTLINDSVKVGPADRPKYLQARYFERGELELSRDENKRLKASETIERLHAKIERLETSLKTYTFDEKATLAKIDQMEKLGAELDQLLKDLDPITAENVKRLNYHIR